MFHDDKHNPHGRFDGLASVYAKHRPDYPTAAIQWIIAKLPPAGLVADVGAGTGILSRQLADYGFHVIGIEPNESMRQEALFQSNPLIDYRPGAAEATGLESQSVDAVVCAQAFHWFDREAALHEFHRILRPDCWLFLLWNSADESDPLTHSFWSILRSSTPEPEVVRDPHDITGQILLDHPLFAEAECLVTSNEQIHNEEGLLGRGFSASFAPKDCQASNRFADDLRALFREYAVDGQVCLRYRTTLYRAIRRD